MPKVNALYFGKYFSFELCNASKAPVCIKLLQLRISFENFVAVIILNLNALKSSSPTLNHCTFRSAPRFNGACQHFLFDFSTVGGLGYGRLPFNYWIADASSLCCPNDGYLKRETSTNEIVQLVNLDFLYRFLLTTRND